MTFARFVTAFLVLVPAAMAADAPAASAAETAKGVPALPSGVHLGKDGRYRKDMCDHARARYCFSERILPRDWLPGKPIPAAGANTGGVPGMSPTDIAAAYQVPANTSAGGKIVAILDLPDSNAFSDLGAYRSNYGLPTLPKCTGASGLPDGKTPCFAQVDETGGPSSGQDSGGDYDGETSLDMDMISAACPDCAILLVEIQLNSDADFTTGVQTAATLGASATSISIGGPENGGEPTGYTTPGHLVLAGSGDWGFDLVDQGGAATPAYPASAPDVVAVGGTTLFLNGSTYDEAVWNDGTFSTQPEGQDVTTSGCSTEFPMPAFQAPGLTGSGCSNRATVDLSAAAAYIVDGNVTDIASYQQGWQQVEGTSASSPMMAGILTRIGLTDTMSNDLSWEYTNAGAFHDLGSTSYPVDPQGSNTDAQDPTTCGVLCTVGTGWDGPSGVGSPNATKLVALVGAPDGGTGESDAGTAGTDSGTAGDATAGSDASAALDGASHESGSTAGNDSGSPAMNIADSGVELSVDAAPSADASGALFDNGSSNSGCACSVPTSESSPLRDMGGVMLALGAVATVVARRRPRVGR